MRRFTRYIAIAAVAASLGPLVYAQNYPHAKPKPKVEKTESASPSKSPSPSPSASASAAPSKTDEKPTGPLKMITTDGKNKDSPIKVVELSYYDAGFGAKFNSEIRCSCKVQNGSSTDELKKVTVTLQIINGAGNVMQSWKQNVGVLKPGQQYTLNPGVWYNNMGIPLQGKVSVEHEEVPKKKGK
jgi:hypothetical protein